tara:strand:+ start:321 stop:998 length:678 start_codon:yes stop_codon:yes gene_type:complete
MTTQSTSATFLGRSGKVYTFENTTVTDGTAGEEMLSGPSPYALTAQSLGDYAQGDVLVAGLVTAQVNIGCAYVSYGGEIVATLPIAQSNVVNSLQNLKKPIMVKPGMVLQVVTNVVATTQYYLAVETSSQSHIFGYTSSGAATGELISILTSQSVGRVLKGTILSAYFTGPLDTTAAPAGAIFVSGQGNPTGFVPLNNSSKSQPMYSAFPIQMDLNSRAQIVADA